MPNTPSFPLPNTLIIYPLPFIYADRFPLAFFLGVSAMVRSEAVCQYIIPEEQGKKKGSGIKETHTRWQRLLQFLGLFGILQDECVQEFLASDLEFDLGVLLVALYACSCYFQISPGP
jgi:hypothetical protein